MNTVTPVCTACGIQVSADVRALQCDRCGDPNKWKCIECLAMSIEAYDMLTDCKELCWFCQGCCDDISKSKHDKDDRIVGLLEKVMNKLCMMEDRLPEKVDVREFVEMESRIQMLEDNMNQKVDE